MVKNETVHKLIRKKRRTISFGYHLLHYPEHAITFWNFRLLNRPLIEMQYIFLLRFSIMTNIDIVCYHQTRRFQHFKSQKTGE